MGASFSSRPSNAGRLEYYSERREAMMRNRGLFSDNVALDIELSKSHWSEVVRPEVAPQSEEELNRENREVLKELKGEYPSLFWNDLSRYVLGRKFAQGGQAKIYKVVGRPDVLMKVFERGIPLRVLQRSCPLPVLRDAVRHCILGAGMLKDGSFAFLMIRCWGDLRKLINQAMQKKNVHGMQGPPFPYKWKDYKRWTFHPVDLMWGIATHMLHLHEKDISHRDLKAANILLRHNFGYVHHSNGVHGIVVADFECSIGVMGTKFWRAPEILATVGNQETITNEQWKQADVYSYGMTCFEIVTGRIPFEGEFENIEAHRQLVIDGKRPQLPSDLDDAMKDLINNCWEPNPSLRPTFSKIVDMVGSISAKQCQFRLFGIGDELPPQYSLATVQESNDYPIALMKAMPGWEIANLANGSVDGFYYGMETRLVKRSDVGHKLARLNY